MTIMSGGVFEKTIWMFWHDWSEAPEIAHQAVTSWRVRNPEWQVKTLCEADLDEIIRPDRLERIRALDIAVQHYSDLIRLELLHEYGGVWADATSFCAWPLDSWLSAYMEEGFFAFSRDASATPERPIANWFLAGQPDSAILTQIYRAVWDYWSDRKRTDDYFWFHRIFSQELKKAEFRARWSRVPALSCMHPFHFGPQAVRLAEPATEQHKALLANPPSPVYKLTHKVLGPFAFDSLRTMIVKATTCPMPTHSGDVHLVLHIGLPKCASTTIQFWADANRDALREHGVRYPKPSPGTEDPKHHDLVRFLMTGGQKALTHELFACDPGETLFLSAEGLTNHLFDAMRDPWALAKLRGYFRPFKLTLVMLRRDPEAWVASYYQQQLRNPPGERFLHGTALPLEAFIAKERVQYLMEAEQVAQDAKAAYGADEIHVFDLKDDWAGALTDVLGVPQYMAESLRHAPRKNEGLNPATAGLLKQANGMLPEAVRDVLRAYLMHEHSGDGVSREETLRIARTWQSQFPSSQPMSFADVLMRLIPETAEERELLQSMKDVLEGSDLCR